MKRPLARLLVAAIIALGAVGATGPIAWAEEFNFPSTCSAVDVANAAPECTSSTVTFTIDTHGNTRVDRRTSFPRQPFDELIREFEGHAGTTEEYLEAAVDDFASDGTSEFSYQLTDAVVTLGISYTLRAALGEAAEVGVVVAGDQINVRFGRADVLGTARVDVSVDGRIIESNGTIDGNTASWTAADLSRVESLTLHASTASEMGIPRWLLALIPISVIGIFAGIYFGFLHKWRELGIDHIDLDPEFMTGEVEIGKIDRRRPGKTMGG